VVRSDYAAVFVVGSSGHQNALVIGDFKQFVVAQRIGLQAEPVQTLFDQATGRPTGQRGFPPMRELTAMSPSRTRCG
jgi:predicted phage gp36 major capsid-like protein